MAAGRGGRRVGSPASGGARGTESPGCESTLMSRRPRPWRPVRSGVRRGGMGAAPRYCLGGVNGEGRSSARWCRTSSVVVKSRIECHLAVGSPRPLAPDRRRPLHHRRYRPPRSGGGRQARWWRRVAAGVPLLSRRRRAPLLRRIAIKPRTRSAIASLLHPPPFYCPASSPLMLSPVARSPATPTRRSRKKRGEER